MEIIIKWSAKTEFPISAISIDSVHNKLIVGLGKKIIYYDPIKIKEIFSLKKHTEDITCLSFRKDGLIFASGAKDNTVYIWDISKSKKATHRIRFSDPLIRIEFNPCFMNFIAMSKTEYSISKEKACIKYPLNKIGVDFCWSNDGIYYAICFEDSSVIIKNIDNDKNEKEIIVNKDKQDKIICCKFSTQRFLYKDYALYICTTNKNFYVFDIINIKIHQNQKLTGNPISISLYKEDFVLIGDDNREINIFSKEGDFLTTITQGFNSWVTSIKNFDKFNSIISASKDGTLICHQITPTNVHAIYRDIYVYRKKNLKDVIIHNLLTGEEQTIEIKGYIERLAIFKNMIAYLSNDKIIVQKINDLDNKEGKYFIKWEGELNFIMLASNHLIVVKNNNIYLYPLTNDMALITNFEKNWKLERDINYLKVLGGAPKREQMLIGTKSGKVYMIYLDNQFPIIVYKHHTPIKSLDINYSRTQLGLIDENYELTVVNIEDKCILYKGEKAESLAFNRDIENMISYNFNGFIYIKTISFPPILERAGGVIIGFTENKVFILQDNNIINVLDISMSQFFMKYVERKQMYEAYEIACLGATNKELAYLAIESLLNFDFYISVQCFKKLKDIKFINLILKLGKDMENGVDKNILRGDIYAHIGNYKKAAELYIKGGKPKNAQKMYLTLKMFKEAIEVNVKYMKSSKKNLDEIQEEQVDWLENNKKYKEAGSLLMALGKKEKAIELYGEYNYLDCLIEICRDLSKEKEADLIKLCCLYFKKNHNYQYAEEAYLKLGDKKSLVYMNVDLKKWVEAFIFSGESKSLNEYVLLKYKESLVLENENINEFNNLKEELSKANKIMEEQKIAFNDLQNKLNICKNILNDLNKDFTNNPNIISQKIFELNKLMSQLNDKNININILDKFKFDEMMCVNFISTDQNVHYALPCIKSNIFAEIEEKLYQQFPQYRETNNIFIANGNQVLRFKTIEENKIGNGLPVTLVLPS